MKLHSLYPFHEERKSRKRIGRGFGSGWGCTSGKGNKGQNARSGGGVSVGFEGGQMPLQRRLPKRGFKNYPFKTVYSVINLSYLLYCFDETTKEITLEDLYSHGFAKRGSLVKILGNGEISFALKVEAHKFSSSAIEKIKKAGGEAISLEG